MGSTNSDYIWKDMIQHEKLLSKIWELNWKCLLGPENKQQLRRISVEEEEKLRGKLLGLAAYKDVEKWSYTLQPSPPVSNLSSGCVGWRSSDLKNSFELYPENYRPTKIHFADQQYGRYREQRYLKSQSEKSHFIMPSKVIRYTVNPLLC